MDKKKSILTIVSMIILIILIIVLVFFINKDSLHLGSKEQQAESVYAEQQVIEEDGKVHGANLSAFLNDESFFDQEDTAEADKEENLKLSLFITSVEKDLRIKVLDDDNNIVQGHEFQIAINDEDVYSDSDTDGIIYIDDLKPGRYQVRLMPVEGFEVPAQAMEARVKAIVSYTVIDDISYLLHTESEITDLTKEDSKATENEDVESDDTQYTNLMNPLDFDDPVQMGIDVSKWNGQIDWEAVKRDGVEFAIIRCAYRGASSGWIVEDPLFKQNLQGAKYADVKVGIYFFTQAINTVEAVEEASTVVELLGQEKIDFPVYIDIEGMGGTGRADGLDKETRTAIADAFCRTIQNAGYEAGVYSSRYWYQNNIDVEKLSDYKIWLAEYREYPLYEGRYEMWQYTSKGTVSGISGWVDLDMHYEE